MAIFLGVLLTSLWPFNIYLLVLFSLLTYIFLPISKYWDVTTITLLLFSVFYSLMAVLTSQYGSGFILLSYLLAPVAFYRLGKWMMSQFVEETIRLKLLICIIACYLLSLFVLTFKDIALVGIVNLSREMVGDQNDTNSLAATLYGLMASVGIGCIAALFTKGQNFALRIGYVILSLLSVLVVIHLINRTGIVVFVCSLIVSVVISTKLNIFKSLPFLILVGFITFLVVNADGGIVGEMVEAYQQREMSSTHDATQLGGRSAIWADALSKLLTHPLGWERTHYAHNLWLDIARVAGWFSLLLFFIPTINWCRDCLCIVRKNATPFILLMISINLSMFLASFVEPVIDGSILFFALFMMIWGVTASLSKEKEFK